MADKIKSRIRNTIVDLGLRFRRTKWENKSKTKLLIAINSYFTKEAWLDAIKTKNLKDVDVVFCSKRLDIVKHYADADICFLFSYNNYIAKNNFPFKRKLIYFPSQGLEFLHGKPIPVCVEIHKAPPVSAEAIAEYCIAMSIIALRNLQHSFYSFTIKKWAQKKILHSSYESLQNKTVGVLGLGKIGSHIALLFKKIGCKVIGCDSNVKHRINSIEVLYSPKELEEFLRKTNILIVCLPLTEDTRNLLTKKELTNLDSNAILINISRGEIVNESDLIEQLKAKKLKAAVIDVFTKEPLASNSAFYKLDNAILTPHVAGNINLFTRKIQADFLQKVIQFKP